MAKGKYDYWRTAEGLLLLEGYARDGLTDEQIAKNIGVRRSTLSDWKVRFPDISDALKKGKDVVDYEVENALLKRALGYTTIEVTRERETDKDGDSYLVITKEVTKEVPPDTTAQIYWLKNRRPEKWRQNPQPENDAGAGGIAELIASAYKKRTEGTTNDRRTKESRTKD